MATITAIEGIGKANAAKLNKIGITTVEGLLEECKSPKGRKKVAADSGIDEKKILTWANHADLFRVKGISSQYAELLEAAGVDTVKELAKRKPENLAAAMAETNAKKKLVRQVPGTKRVEGWVAQAKDMKKVMTY